MAVTFEKSRDAGTLLAELLQSEARALLAQALAAEFEEFLSRFEGLVDHEGKAAVVRNGYQPERYVMTPIGRIPVRIPKSRSRLDKPAVFRSSLVPPYARRAPVLDRESQWIYLHGVSSGDPSQALAALTGVSIARISAQTLMQLKTRWARRLESFRASPLGGKRWAHLYANGIRPDPCAGDKRSCLLIVVGIDHKARKRLLSVEAGVPESKHSWREVLLRLKERGLAAPHRFLVGAGAGGFRAASEEVFAESNGRARKTQEADSASCSSAAVTASRAWASVLFA